MADILNYIITINFCLFQDRSIEHSESATSVHATCNFTPCSFIMSLVFQQPVQSGCFVLSVLCYALNVRFQQVN